MTGVGIRSFLNICGGRQGNSIPRYVRITLSPTHDNDVGTTFPSALQWCRSKIDVNYASKFVASGLIICWRCPCSTSAEVSSMESTFFFTQESMSAILWPTHYEFFPTFCYVGRTLDFCSVIINKNKRDWSINY